MRSLLSIAHHREENRGHVIDVIAECVATRRDGIEIDVVVDCESARQLPGAAVCVWPDDDDRTLQLYAHRRRFAERLEDYDIFAFAIDTSLVRRENLEAFARVSQLLPPEVVAGFLPVAERSDGTRTCPADYGPHHWRADSTELVGTEVFAEFTNQSSRCYALTREQLRRCLSSGRYLVAPRSHLVDAEHSAATGTYRECGLTRVICISDLSSFLVPQTSAGERPGSPLVHLQATAEAAMRTLDGSVRSDELLPLPQEALDAVDSKSYHEPLVEAIVEAIPSGAKRVLSLGTGSGETERALLERGHRVTVVPLDGLIAERLARMGLEVVPSSFDDALAELAGRRFDAIVLSDILHRFGDPVAVLRKLHTLAAVGGEAIATVCGPSPGARLPSTKTQRGHVGSEWEAKPPAASSLRVQRWFVTAGFTGTSSATPRSRRGDGDPSPRCERILLVRGVKREVVSPRTVAEPVRSMVSLGLPVFNGMPYLVECLDALRGQTYPNLEIVISDNGSTDGTEEWCRAAAAEDPRVRYFRHEVNRGAAFNYNYVFQMSRGEFFAWTAHDDLRHVGNVERCVAELERLPASVVTVASSAVFIDESGSVTRFDSDDNSANGESPTARLRHVLRNVNRVNSIWGVTRAAALERTNLIGSFIGSDYVLLAELALLGQVHVLDEQLFARRLHSKASRRAHVSKGDVARWFDVDARTPVLSVNQRLAIEYGRAVGRADLATIDHFFALPSIPLVMEVRRARVRGGLVKRRLKSWFENR